MIDLDRFKLFNDNHGHPAGDRLLTAAGTAWQQRLRELDYLARYGGEEFLVLLPDIEEVRAGQVVDRLRDDTPLNQTFSAGIATWDGRETSDELVARADTAMYIAKQSGRNRTVLATQRNIIG
jgi:diguanylate cyclase (GGDEF)-like protein